MKRKISSLKYVLTKTNENRHTSHFSFQSVTKINKKQKHYHLESNLTITASFRNG